MQLMTHPSMLVQPTKAEALIINNQTVSATSFLRDDVDDITQGSLTIQNNGGITVGASGDGSFKVELVY